MIKKDLKKPTNIFLDKRIQSEIRIMLEENLKSYNSSLTVIVEDGCVFIKGYLPRIAIQSLVEDLVSSIPGVQHIFSQVRFKKAA
jgi:osmotically-inducible protein OsmY